MKHATSHAAIVTLLPVIASLLLGFSQPIHAQQEVCADSPSGRDVFSVGEVRTSILPQQTFQELNGTEWVLMDGRPLMIRSALSPHLTERGTYGLQIPDARGRFLRMANNNACADLQDDQNEEAYNQCLGGHDTDGDRLTGAYQADSFAEHGHGVHAHNFSYTGAREVKDDGDKDDNEDTRARAHGRQGGTSESQVPVSGGKETRPKNIAVNFFIKICNCRTEVCK